MVIDPALQSSIFLFLLC